MGQARAARGVVSSRLGAWPVGGVTALGPVSPGPRDEPGPQHPCPRHAARCDRPPGAGGPRG